jgi:ribonuclease P protein component
VLREGVRLGGERLTVYVVPGGEGTRVTVVCGRAVGRAVDRNRARRLLREAWRAVGARLRGGMDVVVVARPAIRGARSTEVAEDLARTLARGGVIRP